MLSPRLSENVWQVGKGRARGQKAAFHPAFALWALALGFLLSSPFRFRRFSCNDHTTLATACGRLRRRRGSWTREPGSTRLRPNLRRLLKSAEGRDRGGGGGDISTVPRSAIASKERIPLACPAGSALCPLTPWLRGVQVRCCRFARARPSLPEHLLKAPLRVRVQPEAIPSIETFAPPSLSTWQRVIYPDFSLDLTGFFSGMHLT